MRALLPSTLVRLLMNVPGGLLPLMLVGLVCNLASAEPTWKKIDGFEPRETLHRPVIGPDGSLLAIGRFVPAGDPRALSDKVPESYPYQIQGTLLPFSQAFRAHCPEGRLLTAVVRADGSIACATWIEVADRRWVTRIRFRDAVWDVPDIVSQMWFVDRWLVLDGDRRCVVLDTVSSAVREFKGVGGIWVSDTGMLWFVKSRTETGVSIEIWGDPTADKPRSSVNLDDEPVAAWGSTKRPALRTRTRDFWLEFSGDEPRLSGLKPLRSGFRVLGSDNQTVWVVDGLGDGAIGWESAPGQVSPCADLGAMVVTAARARGGRLYIGGTEPHGDTPFVFELDEEALRARCETSPEAWDGRE